MPSNKKNGKSSGGQKKAKTQDQLARDNAQRAAKKAIKQAGGKRAVQKLKAGCADRGSNGVNPSDPMFRHCNY